MIDVNAKETETYESVRVERFGRILFGQFSITHGGDLR